MHGDTKVIIWQQFGGAIDMLANAIRDCPPSRWGDRSRYHEYWYMAYHTLFWLDLYLSGAVEGFAPPPPFTLDELDPAGVLPDRVYTQDEMLGYLQHCREKCRKIIEALSDADARRRCSFPWGESSYAELLLYNMRHVQHHTAQMNLLLRLEGHPVPRWVGRAGRD
jgi:hypothetical protein